MTAPDQKSNYFVIEPGGKFAVDVTVLSPTAETAKIQTRLGKKLSKPFPKISVRFETERKRLPDLTDFSSEFLVSLRFRAWLESKGVSADFVDVSAISRDGQPIPDPYFVLHLTRVIDCFDKIRSDYVPRDDENSIAYSVKKLVLEETKLSGVNIFYVEGIAPLFCSKAFAEEIKSLGFAGVDLVPLSKFWY